MIRVLFVCLGNICRSPLAEGIFLHLVQKKCLGDKISADSAGTSGWHIGGMPDSRSQEVALSHRIMLSSRARKLQESDFNVFDYIIGMDKSNLKDIKRLGSTITTYKAQVKLMRDFETMNTQSQGVKYKKDVVDPYYGGINEFEETYKVLYHCGQNLLAFICKENHL